jgi:ATP-dependent RNA helicase DDX56/DBP9
VAECARAGYFPPGALREGLEMVVLDEADLLLSFGYVDDIKTVMKAVKRGTQVMMLSATMSKEIEELRDIVAHKPTTLDIEDDAATAAGGAVNAADKATAASTSGPNIAHFSLRIPKAADRLLYCMALLRLGLCKKKVLVFVANADAAVRLRLFLHKFGVPTCALHGELPANSRTHILQEFNRGVYDFMIAAADDANMKETAADTPKEEDEEEDEADTAPTRESKKKKKDKRDKEFGVVRGIDFQAVNTVVNFEVPNTAAAYVHRVGRTGRAGKSGTAITLIAPSDELSFSVIQERLSSEVGDTVAATQIVKDFDRLPKEAVDALRYRAEDAARSVGKNAVKEARVRELRQELLNSERLAAHFEDNAEDLALLKHDTSLAKHPDAKHLSHLPGYLRGNKSKRGRDVETDSPATKAAVDFQLDVDVAEFGSKKKRKRNDRRETGPDLRVKNFKKPFVKKKAGRKRSR